MEEVSGSMNFKNQQAATDMMVSERKLIKTGNVAFVTKDTDATRRQIYKLTAQYGGYVSGDDQSGIGDSRTNSVHVRIPSDKFDVFLMDVLEGSESVDSKNVHIEDVTEEYIDVEARVKAKKALEDRYLALLQQAKTVKEVLEVEQQIGSIREEIETVEGRKRYLENSVAFSTVHLHFYGKTAVVDNGPGFGKSIQTGWDNLIVFLAGLLSVWPFLIFLFIGWLIFRRWYKRQRTQHLNRS